MIKKLIFLIILLVAVNRLFAQRERLDQITDSITNEGKTLYRSEWASWYGTDVFVDKCKSIANQAGGYFSYETPDSLINLFFTKGDMPSVLARIYFGKELNSRNYRLDTMRHQLSTTERGYYDTRAAVSTRIRTDTIFKYFKNTNLNIVPLIEKDIRRAYVLTGTSASGVVIFGNDYLINFDKNNDITSVKKLHKNMMPAYPKADTSKIQVGGMHTHLPESGEFMTATDICTVMLNEKFTDWKTYYTISKNYISIWDCKKNELVILTMDAWKRISDDQKIRHPDKQ